MPSLDIVSRIDFAELDNAINNTKKAIATRFDFRNSPVEFVIDKKEKTLKITSEDGKQEAVRDIFGDEAWRMAALPLLMRPAWLLPLSASVVLAGLAFSLRSRSDVSGQPRLRN